MEDIDKALGSAIASLSDQNHTQSLAFYRFWFDIGQTYHQIPPDQIFDAIWNNRWQGSGLDPGKGQLIHLTAHLVVRFVSDAESDHILAPHSLALGNRLCERALREFFRENLKIVWSINSGRDWPWGSICTDANLVAHWANLGCVGEATIRNHILQSLISHSKLHDHQADALIVLFKLAGATFEAYADPSVVDRCFELLKDHSYHNPYRNNYWSSEDIQRGNSLIEKRREVVQEVLALRQRGWEGLPPPPVFTTGKTKITGANQKDPAATPVVTSLGLPNRDLEPRISQSPPESITVPEADTIPPFTTTPVTQSPSISITTLSDFTIPDASDDEPPTDPTIPDTSDDERPTDPVAATPHETFYLDDGNVEVLCGNRLFRVHISTLSFHSPALRRMFVQTNLAVAESPNGCPRILSSDAPKDFATLLKTVYLPGFPERNKVPDFTTFSSLLRLTTKYEMPTVRSQMLEVVRDAYPETFEGLDPSKPLGESAFSGPTPHPNEVLNLFIQQGLTSALPMAYYMATRRGLDSLMDRRLPASARLSPEIIRVAMKGLLTLREMELKEIHCLVLGSKGSRSCSLSNCPSRSTTGPGVSEALRKVADRITDSTHSGTKLLQVLLLREVCGGNYLGFCENCVGEWEAGHADLRKKAWAALPGIFGLKG